MLNPINLRRLKESFFIYVDSSGGVWGVLDVKTFVKAFVVFSFFRVYTRQEEKGGGVQTVYKTAERPLIR